MKKLMKIMILIIILITMPLLVTTVHASGVTLDLDIPEEEDEKDIWGLANEWVNPTEDDLNKVGLEVGGGDSITEPINELSGFLFGTGVIVVVILTAVLGIRMMLANPEEKSKIKQAYEPLLVGAVIIFGGITIWKILVDVFQ